MAADNLMSAEKIKETEEFYAHAMKYFKDIDKKQRFGFIQRVTGSTIVILKDRELAEIVLALCGEAQREYSHEKTISN